MKTCIACCLYITASLCLAPHAQAQGFLKKLKDKVNEIKGTPTTTTTSGTNTDNSSTNNTGSPTNKTGAGLTNTEPPDVLTNIASAQAAGKDSNMSQARYALQQAIMGVEIKLGRQIINSLPNTVDGLTKDTTKNVVSSTQFGWNNMTILTVYGDGKDKQMTVTIGNLPMYAGMVSMYFGNTYIQNGADKNANIKQVQVKGEKAIIQFDQSTGYNLVVQLGQSTIFALQCVNFATEAEVMAAANTFDIAGIKKMMGEQ